MQSYVERSLESAKRVRDVVLDAMDAYWTPFEGHKVSRRSSVEKWNDFLFVAQSGQRTAASEEEKLVYFQLECVVATQLKDWQAAA
jgi:hypothetical protein